MRNKTGVTLMRWFACAFFALSLIASADNQMPVDVRVLPSQRELLRKGADLLSSGDVSQGQAYLDLAESAVDLKVGVDTTGCVHPEAAIRAAETAVATWTEMHPSAHLTIVPLSQANVRIHARPQVGPNSHLAGHANWVKRVVQTGFKTYKPRVTADVTVATHDHRGQELSEASLAYVTAHELGHVLGLDDTGKVGELMGPGQLDHPITAPAEPELRALSDICRQAELVARVSPR